MPLIPRMGISYFNPRSRKGSDGVQTSDKDIIAKFQSTLPQGERRGWRGTMPRKSVFQSTLPQGERLILKTIRPKMK